MITYLTINDNEFSLKYFQSQNAGWTWKQVSYTEITPGKTWLPGLGANNLVSTAVETRLPLVFSRESSFNLNWVKLLLCSLDSW